MPFTVIISPAVQELMLDQSVYIARDSMINALAWERRLRAAIDTLGETHGHAVDEEASARSGRPVRKLVFERTYLIFYRVDEVKARIDVVNFRHGARVPRGNEP